MANYTVVDGTHLQLTLNKVHAISATIAVGGLCGYGLEQTVDTTAGIRQLFPVIGSISSTSLYYADAATPVVGNSAAITPYYTSGYLNFSGVIASLARSSNVVTLTTSANIPADLNGLSLVVSGAADSSYNGTYAATTTGPNTLTYLNTGANSTSSGGTVSYLTGGYVLYPMAEVLSVLNPATQQIDGGMSLAPNTVAWASGDPVEQPHYYQEGVSADLELITQYVPRPIEYVSAGKQYQGLVGPGMRGWQITNADPASTYLGGGGTHGFPDIAYFSSGVWNNDFEADAGVHAALRLHCNLHGCNRWDSGYALFDLDSQSGEDFLNFAPQSDTVTWSLAGNAYSFSPTSFTAGTINVGTLNATTITGGVNGSAITAGTVSAARLPVFGASGSSHAAGIVPDPGATAGSTHYLREDGTWSVPSAGSGSMTWPSVPGIAVCMGTPCATWGTSLTAPSGTIVGTTDTQTLANKTLDGVSPTTMSYVDPTSSIQTQLNARQVTGSYLTALTGDVTASGPGSAAVSVVKVNGASIPTSQTAVGTNSSGQFVAATRYQSCQPGLGDGLNAIPAGTYLTTTCRNETGATWTVTAIRCVADSGSSTCNATNGSGTGLLTGVITGSSTYANGTQSGTTTIANGDYLKITFIADGTSKQIGIDVAGTY